MKTQTPTIEIQTGALGREFRLSGIKYDTTKPVEWINKKPAHWYWQIFRYMDDGSFFGYYFNPFDKCVSKLTHQEVLELYLFDFQN